MIYVEMCLFGLWYYEVMGNEMLGVSMIVFVIVIVWMVGVVWRWIVGK